MVFSSIPPSRQRNRRLLTSTVTLALWRLRRTWGLLVVTGVGMVAAVMLVCAMPLYLPVIMAVGLRSAVATEPPTMDVSLGTTTILTPQSVSKATQEVDAAFRKELGPYLTWSRFSLQSEVYFIMQEKPRKQGNTGTQVDFHETNDQVQFVGTSIKDAASHLKLVSGRLPETMSKDVEIALSTESAKKLHVSVGSVITVGIAFVDIPVNRIVVNVPIHVVGLFSGNATTADPYWQQLSLLDAPRGSTLPGTIYTGLVSAEAFQATFARLAGESQLRGYVPEEGFTYDWFYPLNSEKVTAENVNALLANMYAVQADLDSIPNLNTSSSSQQTLISAQALEQYSDDLSMAQIPLMSLIVLILGLILYFISVMADLLVERQTDTIALLRSRGASTPQIFGAMLTQSLGLGLIALLLGPLLAFGSVYGISLRLFSDSRQPVLSIILNNSTQTLWTVFWYALAASISVTLAMIIAMFPIARRDMLAMLRESARAHSRPFWQRLNLDIVFAIVMLTCSGISLYLTGSDILDPQLRSSLQAPLTLLRSVCLVLACTLFLLRFFPFLLQRGSQMAARSWSAAPMLAVAQMARTPRQAARMTLLLALSTAFAIFALTFTASQAQRVFDVSNYEGGADFSGTMVNPLSPPPMDAATTLYKTTALYRHIPGVLSATLGFADHAVGGANLNTASIQLRAVDADTFAYTANWSSQDSSLPLSSLMAQLAARREATLLNDTLPVPAIVDDAGWNALHLSPNAPFSLKTSDGIIVHFVAIAEVHYIPSVTDDAQTGDVNGGVLVDFQSYANIYAWALHNIEPTNLQINYVWLHTKSDSASLASVRKALHAGPLQLSPLYDRYAAAKTMIDDPLYLAFFFVPAMGAIMVLSLALVSTLIASWLSARSRLANFATLRALGMSPRSLAGVFIWEQGIIYTTAFVLGVLFGSILSALVVPALIFTSVASNVAASITGTPDLYVTQTVPPIQVVVSPSLIITFAALLSICLLALCMMLRVVSRPSIGQTLRLS